MADIEREKLLLTAVVFAQIESRLHSLDISGEGKIIWSDIAPQLSRLCGRVFSPREAQQLWRHIAYNEDVTTKTAINSTSALLPDSDEETIDKKAIKPNDIISRGLAARSRFRELCNSEPTTIEQYAERALPLIESLGAALPRLEEALRLREDRKRELIKLVSTQKRIESKPSLITKALEIAGRIVNPSSSLPRNESVLMNSSSPQLIKKSSAKRKRGEEEVSEPKETNHEIKETTSGELKQLSVKDWVSSLGLLTPSDNQYQLAHSIVRKAWKQQARMKIPAVLKKKAIIKPRENPPVSTTSSKMIQK